MEVPELLPMHEIAILAAVQRGALRPGASARRVPALDDQPTAEVLMHDALRCCEHRGYLRSRRTPRGRSYSLTAAGRARLRAQRRFACALAALMARSRLG
jgi:DNA-binding PadR family transcriptional regulator